MKGFILEPGLHLKAAAYGSKCMAALLQSPPNDLYEEPGELTQQHRAIMRPEKPVHCPQKHGVRHRERVVRLVSALVSGDDRACNHAQLLDPTARRQVRRVPPDVAQPESGGLLVLIVHDAQELLEDVAFDSGQLPDVSVTPIGPAGAERLLEHGPVLDIVSPLRDLAVVHRPKADEPAWRHKQRATAAAVSAAFGAPSRCDAGSSRVVGQ